MVKKCNLVVFNAEMVSIGAKKNELLRPSTLVGASQSNSMKSQSVDLLVERLRRLGSARSARKLSLSIKFQFIGGMKVGEPSADGRGSAPPELAEHPAQQPQLLSGECRPEPDGAEHCFLQRGSEAGLSYGL